MEKIKLELYWNDIPFGRENALTYVDLCYIWRCEERKARQILHELSCYDDGSDFVLIRSASGKGFYKTDDIATIQAYRRECLEKGRSVFAPLRKINRIINNDSTQYHFENNLRLIRTERKMSLSDVVEKMKQIDSSFDKPMLSKMENNYCLPTYMQLAKLSEIYGCEPNELVSTDLFM